MVILGKRKIESNVQIPIPPKAKNLKRLITMHRRILEMYRNEYIKYGHMGDDYKEYIAIGITTVEVKLDKLKTKLNKSPYHPIPATVTLGDILLKRI